MRFVLVCTGLALALGGLVGCGAGGDITGSSYNPGYGPFDRRGNYVEAWADKPAKKHWWARKPETPPVVKPTTPPKEQPTIAANTPRTKPPALPTPTVRQTPTRPTYTPPPPKPKPVVVKPKPKPKPKRRHTVVSGDTLYSLSRRYGTSVSAIQRANGLKGTTIVVGKSLVIP